MGKTAVALNDMVDQIADDRMEAALVLCPNSLKSNWCGEYGEAKKWGVRIPHFMYPNLPAKPPFILAMNYDALLYDGYDIALKMARSMRLGAYLDESQKIKNPSGNTSKAVLSLRNEFVRHRLLTGTPMTDTVMDLWPQLNFIGATRLKPHAFRNRYTERGGFMGKKIVDTKNEEELRKLYEGFVFRALKKDWLDLPEKIHPHPIKVELSANQLQAYRSMQEDFIVLLNELEQQENWQTDEVSVNLVVTQLLKLQQIAAGFLMYDDGKVVELVAPAKNPRILAVKEAIDAAPGKVIVFCKHRYSAEMLLQALAGYGCSRLVGGMKDTEITAEKSLFNCNGGNRVLVTQTSVGGTGHTFLGGDGEYKCSTSVYYENDFNLGNRMQSEDRNHRHGQDRGVVYVDFVSSPIDVKVIEALQKKQDIVERIVDGAKRSA